MCPFQYCQQGIFAFLLECGDNDNSILFCSSYVLSQIGNFLIRYAVLREFIGVKDASYTAPELCMI